MKQRAISALSLATLFVFGVAAFIVAMHGQTAPSRFLLALFPLLMVLFGVAFLRQSGLTMAIVGLVLTIGLAVFQFGTPPEVALGASVLGFMSSFGISISVAVTMLMIFLMRETGALQTVSKVIKRQVVGNEVQALYIGIGFGSFLSCLGVVTLAARATSLWQPISACLAQLLVAQKRVLTCFSSKYRKPPQTMSG